MNSRTLLILASVGLLYFQLDSNACDNQSERRVKLPLKGSAAERSPIVTSQKKSLVAGLAVQASTSPTDRVLRASNNGAAARDVKSSGSTSENLSSRTVLIRQGSQGSQRQDSINPMAQPKVLNLGLPAEKAIVRKGNSINIGEKTTAIIPTPGRTIDQKTQALRR